jgi:hypothetical protein
MHKNRRHLTESGGASQTIQSGYRTIDDQEVPMHHMLNPYAACDLDEHALAGEAEHEEFQLVGDRIRCRSGLRLPAWCLLTGDNTHLLPFPFVVHGWPRRLRWARRLGFSSMIGSAVCSLPAAAALQAISTYGSHLLSPQMLAAARAILSVTTLGLICGGAFFFLVGARGSRKARFIGFVSESSLRSERRLQFVGLGIFGTALAVLCIGSLTFSLRVLIAMSFVIAFTAFSVVRSPAMALALCRADFDGDGVFELSGLRKTFLKRLRAQPREPSPGA